MEFIDLFSAAFNSAFDKIAAIVFLAWLMWLAFRYIRKSIATEADVGKKFYMAIMVCLGVILLASIIYLPFPQLLFFSFREKLDVATIRWVIVYLIAIIWSYSVSYKKAAGAG